MARPERLPFLNPRRPRSQLGWALQKARIVHGWTGKQVAEAFGCSAVRISRVEHGDQLPSDALLQFYESAFNGDGLLNSLFQAAKSANEQAIRRSSGHRPRIVRAKPGDASTFVGDSVPNGTLLKPGQFFVKTWTVQNSGSVPWIDRRLERQGPYTGPGLITSPPDHIPILDTQPGETVTITALLKAPTYDCSSIAYFKMIDSEGQLCFPDNYALGLEVLVLVRDQQPDDLQAVEDEAAPSVDHRPDEP